MNQNRIAESVSCSKNHLNAVIKGRIDAGKNLASKLTSVVGGSIELWMFPKFRRSRKAVVDSYISAFEKARKSN